MCLGKLCAAVLLLCLTGVCAGATYVVPTTTLAAQTANNTSAATSFVAQTNGNSAAGNVSKVDVHSLLYAGATTKVYAHLMLWFGGSDHMNVGYSSTDSTQVHNQIVDMISRGIDGVVIDWYGPNNSIDQATQLVMKEAESHPGFTFAIMVDQGAIQWNSCSGCTPEQALIAQMQYVEQTYFPSPAYMTLQGRPMVTNFGIDDSYTIDWSAVGAALATQPVFLFQNNGGFTHVLSGGGYSWVIPTTTDYGMSYLTSFYDTGIPLITEETFGATYKGFNDTLAAWGSNRIMGQQCSQTWLQTFSAINGLYNSGSQLAALQLVTWNDYEEGTEIESGISNCFSVTASASSNTLQWNTSGNSSTVDHYLAYISTDGQNLMSLANVAASANSVNLCSYAVPNGSYTLYVQAVGKPSITNFMSGPVTITTTCQASGGGSPTVTFTSNPSSLSIRSGGSGNATLSATVSSGTVDNPLALACSGLPATLTCSFAPATITPGSGTVSSVLTLAAVKVAALDRRDRGSFVMATWFFSFGLFGLTLIGKLERKRIVSVFGACVLAAVIVGTTSCAGVASNQTTAAAAKSNRSTYVVTVNGSSSSVQVSTTISVTVN